MADAEPCGPRGHAVDVPSSAFHAGRCAQTQAVARPAQGEPTPSSTGETKEQRPGPTQKKPSECKMCSKPFPSRAAVFRHLRDPRNECGKEVEAQGGIEHGRFLPSNNAMKREVLAKRDSGGGDSPTSACAGKRTKREGVGDGHTRFSRHVKQITSSADAELWLGDIPPEFASLKRLRAVIWSATPANHPQPFIKRFFRKGYRSRAEAPGAHLATAQEGATATISEEPVPEKKRPLLPLSPEPMNEVTAPSAQAPSSAAWPYDASGATASLTTTEHFGSQSGMPNPTAETGDGSPLADSATRRKGRTRRAKGRRGGVKDTRPWLGYAILSYRNDAEATQALGFLDGHDTGEGFVFRVKRARSKRKDDKEHKPSLKVPNLQSPACAAEGTSLSQPAEAPPLGIGEDPDPNCQVTALTSEQVEARVTRRAPKVAEALVSQGGSWALALADSYRASPRQVQQLEGCPLPPGLQLRLVTVLRALLWPAKRHRAKVVSDHYLVIWRGRPRNGYDDLHAATEALMEWADPGFPYTHVAVTKNFRGSPHTDSQDTSYQYAVSLGGFTGGGELCVESEACDGDLIHVVNTHNRIARVDGRFTHWVRGYGGGDRYSLIYFCTDDKRGTPAERAVHTHWRAAGAAAP